MTGTLKQYVLICMIVIIGTIGSLAMLDAFAKSNRLYRQPGRIDSQRIEKIIVNTPGEAYSAWKESGYRGREIVYVAGSWERLDNSYEAPAARPYPLRLFRLSEIWGPADLTSANFLYFANLNRIIRRIRVILPEEELKKVTDRARTTKEYGIDKEGLYFPYQGLPRWFSTSAGFRPEKEPALLYVNASYFRNGEPEDLFKRLAVAGLETDSVILCRESGDTHVTDRERRKLEQFGRLIGISSMVEAGGGK